MQTLSDLRFALNTCSVYRTDDPTLAALEQALRYLESDARPHRAVRAYCDFVRLLYAHADGDLRAHVNRLLRDADNPFSRAECAQKPISPYIRDAALSDLQTLTRVAALNGDALRAAFCARFPDDAERFAGLPDFDSDTPVITPDELSRFYRKNGFGIYARYKAFTFSRVQGAYRLAPVVNPDPIRLDSLKQYELQRGQVVNNTLAFLNGKPYNNVLLYGDRGTGKSSTVKALLNEYADRGLRLIQIDKQNLYGLAELAEQLIDVPLKFILFVDDLTFNENDDGFGMLKAVLEGGVVKRPDNIAIYATSNRRHLVKETFTAREGDEVHAADTRDEVISLSDRFGLTVTFSAPRMDGFLEIVRLIAQDRGLAVEEQTLLRGAEQFALRRGGRSPRVAQQYVDYLESLQPSSNA